MSAGHSTVATLGWKFGLDAPPPVHAAVRTNAAAPNTPARTSALRHLEGEDCRFAAYLADPPAARLALSHPDHHRWQRMEKYVVRRACYEGVMAGGTSPGYGLTSDVAWNQTRAARQQLRCWLEACHQPQTSWAAAAEVLERHSVS